MNSPIIISVVHLKITWILVNPKSVWDDDLPDNANVQANLILRKVHMFMGSVSSTLRFHMYFEFLVRYHSRIFLPAKCLSISFRTSHVHTNIHTHARTHTSTRVRVRAYAHTDTEHTHNHHYYYFYKYSIKTNLGIQCNNKHHENTPI